ncbi:MAG: adenylate kinase [Clostridia bacterium]|nr:adenylate kinase [Clostridia bacterium]MBQ7504626.1 adenylate kinase [Ruminococcus sp.]
MNIIMLGAPGAGKGTQAAVLCEKLNIPTISTGNIIREALKNGTEMGKKAKSFMDAGQLVPDEVVIGIVKDRLQEDDCKNGYILDGFPRTIPQAEALDAMGADIDCVIDIEVQDEVIVNRLSGRRVCENCGRPYHVVSLKPKVDGVCDDCKGALVQRKDDQIETIKNRLDIYHKETEPLVKYYEAQGKLKVVVGKDTVDATTAAVFDAIGV